ncbi:MAG: protoheme IX farnesyltransferase [candidate division Zixibacteria bacterium]|nr:protoheme IX farnesyltransferase [candidate division Zixibacteria bacterium]
MKASAFSLFQLTKPTIMLLVLTTGITALIIEGSMISKPGLVGLFLLGLFMTGGSANALNQYFERDIDSRMTRTYGRRPLPLGKVSGNNALIFGLGIGTGGVLLLGFVFNWLTALLALSTILFYSLFYTLYLKPTTNQNIVIGGIAGAMVPVGAWTAASGSMALMPWLLFLIIFFWTPPHFWSLAICYKDDYKKVNLPMLPVTRGDKTTLNSILIYTVALVIISLLPLIDGFGLIYFAIAVILGTIFIWISLQAKRFNNYKLAWRLFRYSIVYIFMLFLGLIIDAIV